MMTSSWLTATLGALSTLLSADGVLASSRVRQGASPYFLNSDSCPERCSVSGPDTGNWSAYPDFKQLQRCQQTMFYDFSLYDNVDDLDTTHRIQACSSFGPDFSMLELPEATSTIPSPQSIIVNFEVGWWDLSYGLAASGIRSLINQLLRYIDRGHGATDRAFIMFGRSGQASIGLYIGKGLQNQGLSAAMKVFQDNLENLNGETPSLAMQLCEPGYDSTHIFGIIVTSNGSFNAIQNAIKTWSNATCLSFSGSTNFTSEAMLTTLLVPTNGTTLLVPTNGTALHKRHIAHHAQHNAYHSQHKELEPQYSELEARAECKTVQVESGDSCASLATKCGLPSAAFTKVNSAADFCSSLKPKQHVCCSSGTLPDFSPQPNADGSCSAYEVVADDNCVNLASEYSLTKQDLEDFNTKTWGWNTCELLFVGTRMCLSKGTPPFPATIANAVCGPQKPDTEAPTDDSDISELNPCPLNACCNIWGQCGITTDFCVDTNTGAPGTAELGTYGCISNCGTDVVKGTGGNIRIAYYEGYSMNRECLYQDASQIDASKYTHVHFAFGTLTPEFEVDVGDVLSTYNFNTFKTLTNVKKVLSFGGWAFSNDDATYMIFRNGVTVAQRLKMATNMANFIIEHNLDGIDIDWEYPGAPDLPDVTRAGTKEDGPNYLAFLVILKNLLSGSGKTVSIAAPSSYWYLKQFPINNIGKIVDYIVYMTYDLHGQWDTGNAYAQEGCDNGNCLRSQVNLTETKQSLAMITKAGVPGSKVIVGVTSYGRSFNMAEAGCWGPTCLYTGDRGTSQATPGKCTGTSGYIADAEIAEIMAGTKRDGRVVKSFVDTTSNSDVLIYDDLQYVSYMSASTKLVRQKLYNNLGLGGTSDWATDLQEYNDAPNPSGSWSVYIQDIKDGYDPKTDNNRTGNWTSYECTNYYVDEIHDSTSEEKWNGLSANAAWRDVLRIWLQTDSKRKNADGSPLMVFSESVSSTLKVSSSPTCGDRTDSECDDASECTKGMDGVKSGPAGQLIWNSLVAIHQMFSSYYDALVSVAATVSPQLQDFENNFAPVPDEPDNKWLLLFIDLLTVGTLSVAAPFFNDIIKTAPYFKTGISGENSKDTSMTLIGQSTTIAKDMIPSDDATWDQKAQAKFSSYMGQVFEKWQDVSELALTKIFDGSDASITVLSSAIANGKLFNSKIAVTNRTRTDLDDAELRAYVRKTFFGYSIPALWRVSKTRAFILDSGVDCGGSAYLDQYISTATADATGKCINNRLYYLVHPEGNAQWCPGTCLPSTNCESCNINQFSIPPGVNSMDGISYGGITKDDLIQGSYNSWIKSDQQNMGIVGGFADLSNEDITSALFDGEITTAGIIRLPVCSPEVAWQTWSSTTNISAVENYPCGILTIPEGIKTCGQYTYEDQRSDASPDIQDCLQILRNIELDETTSYSPSTATQKAIVSFGGCALGVEIDGVKGNVDYTVGGQDIQNIINEAINLFGKDGKVGAKGTMNCAGNSVKQPVIWGLY